MAAKSPRAVTEPEAIPFRDLGDTVGQPIRLAILTVLNQVEQADFSYLKKLLEVTDGNLGRHIEVLATNELVDVHKEFNGKRPRTWCEITKRGRTALALHIEAMRAVVAQYEADK